MRFAAIIFLLVATLQAFGHEGHQAFYRITEENGELVLTVKMDMPDVEVCLQQENVCGTDQELKWCAAKWTSGLLAVKIDGKEITKEFESSYTEMGHLILRYTLGTAPKEGKTLEVSNTCFLGSFDTYDNIVQISVGSVDQGYMMNELRTNIKIELTNRS
ncbi:MAG: hypothetical protein GC178_09575 [Flavobacteriales bacterium]|nr:hypothetical protein [Flavobacteriales bacterium]